MQYLHRNNLVHPSSNHTEVFRVPGIGLELACNWDYCRRSFHASNTNDIHDIPPHEPPLHASSYPLPWMRKWPTVSTTNFNMTTFLVSLLLQRIKGAFHSTKLIPKGRKRKSLQKIRKLLNLRQDKPSDWKLRNKKNSGRISNGKEVLGKISRKIWVYFERLSFFPEIL